MPQSPKPFKSRKLTLALSLQPLLFLTACGATLPQCPNVSATLPTRPSVSTPQPQVPYSTTASANTSKWQASLKATQLMSSSSSTPGPSSPVSEPVK